MIFPWNLMLRLKGSQWCRSFQVGAPVMWSFPWLGHLASKPRKGDIGNALFIVHAGMLKVQTGRSLETGDSNKASRLEKDDWQASNRLLMGLSETFVIYFLKRSEKPPGTYFWPPGTCTSWCIYTINLYMIISNVKKEAFSNIGAPFGPFEGFLLCETFRPPTSTINRPRRKLWGITFKSLGQLKLNWRWTLEALK